MKRSIKWALLPTAFAVLTAMTPFGFSTSGSGVVGVSDAQCMDCMVKDGFTCGTPPLDREGYCTAGADWCKAAEQ